jgi:hypothetical protein
MYFYKKPIKLHLESSGKLTKGNIQRLCPLMLLGLVNLPLSGATVYTEVEIQSKSVEYPPPNPLPRGGPEKA